MCVRQRSAEVSSSRESAIGANAANAAYKNQPSQTLSPRPPRPSHAVVPVAGSHEGQTVGADGEAAVERCGTVIEQRPLLRRLFGPGSRRPIPICSQLRPVQVRDHLVEHLDVARHLEVSVDDIREPDSIVGNSGANAATRRRVPPVLDVAFDELSCGRSEQMLACLNPRLAVTRAITSCSWSRTP